MSRFSLAITHPQKQLKLVDGKNLAAADVAIEFRAAASTVTPLHPCLA